MEKVEIQVIRETPLSESRNYTLVYDPASPQCTRSDSFGILENSFNVFLSWHKMPFTLYPYEMKESINLQVTHQHCIKGPYIIPHFRQHYCELVFKAVNCTQKAMSCLRLTGAIL